mmetsp:Transcript_113526/g.316164  ORF Transcript_113526/g.316164 Transcript_113526/m.316164 type:complete len:342 (-) Transcript_113526:97-1122(-)
MSHSDRLFLEGHCPALHQRLVQKLVEDPNAQILEQDFQDFEVHYSILCQGTVLTLTVQYPFLAEVWQHGLQGLLEQVWSGLPLQWRANAAEGALHVEVDTAAFGEDSALRSRCAQSLATTRTWLLIAPLVDRLRWLRDATARGADAAKTAAPGNAAVAAAAALGTPPPLLALRVRRLETCWIVCKPDRVLVIMSVHLDDEVDVALGRAFCQEFAETGRKPGDFSLPCSFNEPKDVPSDLRGVALESPPNVGFLTLTLSDQCVRKATEERLQALARPVMTFRNFFHFHLKHAKSFLHSRLRKKIESWQAQLSGARRATRGKELRRLATGKVFVPPPRSSAPA